MTSNSPIVVLDNGPALQPMDMSERPARDKFRRHGDGSSHPVAFAREHVPNFLATTGHEGRNEHGGIDAENSVGKCFTDGYGLLGGGRKLGDEVCCCRRPSTRATGRRLATLLLARPDHHGVGNCRYSSVSAKLPMMARRVRRVACRSSGSMPCTALSLTASAKGVRIFLRSRPFGVR